MRTKLVRDRCNAVKEGQCERAQSKPEYLMSLTLKLHEEAQEIANDPSNSEEYADLLEVMWQLASEHGLSLSDITEAYDKKRKEIGGFEEGQIWTEVTL